MESRYNYISCAKLLYSYNDEHRGIIRTFFEDSIFL